MRAEEKNMVERIMDTETMGYEENSEVFSERWGVLRTGERCVGIGQV